MDKEQEIEIAYELPKNNMISIDANVISEWIRINEKLHKNKRICTVDDLELLTFTETHPLNILYEIIKNKFDLRNN